MATTWILIAHGIGGKIIETENTGKQIVVKRQFSHPQTAVKDVDIHSDRPGRTFSRTTKLRHAIDLREDPKDHERRLLAKEIAHYLLKALDEGSFDSLILVASHELLGELRLALSPVVMGRVSHQLSKDLLTEGLSDKELMSKIREDLNLVHF